MFHELLVRPLFNALVFFYEAVGLNDLGIAIILLTVIIRLVLYPLFYRGYKNQALMQKIQPEIRRIQHDHKSNRERQAQDLLALYKQHKINPFSGFFLILVQLPILIALFQVFRAGISPDTLQDLYSFVAKPEMITNSFLGLLELTKPNIIIVGLAAVAQYFQGKLTLPTQKENQKNQAPSVVEKMSKQMVFLGPVLTVVFFFNLPAAIGIYWLTTSAFSLAQQIFINRSLNREFAKNGANSDQNKNHA